MNLIPFAGYERPIKRPRRERSELPDGIARAAIVARYRRGDRITSIARYYRISRARVLKILAAELKQG